MITATNIALAYGKRVIFQDVNIKFIPQKEILSKLANHQPTGETMGEMSFKENLLR